MQINNSVSMLTTQRAMSSAGKDMTEAMERLATGTKINNSADDPIGHSISQKMSAQIQSLNTAIKNANDGIALTRSIEGAIGTLTDMLQRMRELAMQSTNGTNSNIDRSFLQEEVEMLQKEITRVSETTRYNGELILDGRFKNQSFMVGAESSDEIRFSVDSVASEMIGAHTYIGNGLEAMPSTTSVGDRNLVTAAHGVEIKGYSGTKLIESDIADTAEMMADKINRATGETGVKADAKTIGLLSFSGTPAVKVTTAVASVYLAGTYYLQKADGTKHQFFTSAATAAEFQTKIRAMMGDDEFKVTEVDGGTDHNDELKFEGPSNFGDFDILGHDFTKLTGGNATTEVVGVNSARFRLNVNGVATGNFVMNESFADEAVWAINQISGQTGVIATQEDHKVVLTDPNGGDITVENLSAGIGLALQKVGDDGVSTIGGPSSIGVAGANDSIRVSGTIKLSSAEKFTVAQLGDKATAAVKVTTGTVNTYGAGDYYIINSNGTRTNFTTTASTTAEFQAKIRAATGDNAFTVVEVDGGTNNDDEMKITGPKVYGDFDIYKADGTKITGGTAATEIMGSAQPGYFAIPQDLYVQKDASALTGVGQLSLVGDILYEGTGTSAIIVGRVDGSKDGLNGEPFKFNLNYEFENGDFEDGSVGDTTIPGWQVYNKQIRLNGNSTVAGHPTPDDTVFPANVDTGQNAPYDATVISDANPAVYETKLSSQTSTGSGKSVMLKSSDPDDMVPSYGILHGPYLASQKAVKLQAGDKIEFDWRATGGDDAYDVMGYLVDEETGRVEEILNQTGANGSASTNWATVSKDVSEAGKYKFVFIAGTWDASGGQYAGAKLFIDNVKIDASPPVLSAAAIQQLGQRLVTTAEGFPQPFKAVMSNESFEFRIDDSGESTLYQVSDVDVSNSRDAGKSINIIDNALDKLSLMRSEMGAMETRLNQVISKQIGISEQTTVSRSRIEDADYALEAARLSKTQVIQQAGASVLVQANEITRMAIELLKR